MLSILALGMLEKTINKIIDLDSITRNKLNRLHGKTMRIIIDSPQLSIDIYFDIDCLHLEPTATGQKNHLDRSIFEQRPAEYAQYSQAATATVHVDHVVALFKLLMSEQYGCIPVEGDSTLLMQLKEIMQNSEIDLASHLSPLVGATLAHEIGKLQHIPHKVWQQTQNGAFAVQDYLKEDSHLFALRWQMDDINQKTRQLNQEIDRLEARLQQLKQQIEY